MPRCWNFTGWILIGLVVLWAGPAAAQSVWQWARTVSAAQVDGADLPPSVRSDLDVLAAQAINRSAATTVWVMPLIEPGQTRQRKQRKRRKRRGKRARKTAPRLLVLAAAEKGGGVLVLVEPDRKGLRLHATRPVPAPDQTRWRRGGHTDIDGDRRADHVIEWTQTARNFTRNGMVIVRTQPDAIALIELGSETVVGAGRRTVKPQIACFFPVHGLGGKALIVQRREETIRADRSRQAFDAMELFVPGADGKLVNGHVYGAMYGGTGERRGVLKRWGEVFSLRRPDDALTRQATPGACPAAAVVLPKRALGQSASPHPLAIVGPFATTSMGVRTVLKSMRKGPRAAVVIGIGSL